jgi:hypothetical protein
MPGHRQRALARLWNVGAGFSGAWGAMMCPSVAPMVALYSRIIRERSPVSPLFSTAGHLVTREGLLTFAIALAGTASPPMGSRGITQGGGSPARRSSARWSTGAAAKGRLPREVPQPAPSRARLLARPLGRRAGDGRQERCLMRRVWLGARGREDCPWRRSRLTGPRRSSSRSACFCSPCPMPSPPHWEARPLCKRTDYGPVSPRQASQTRLPADKATVSASAPHCLRRTQGPADTTSAPSLAVRIVQEQASRPAPTTLSLGTTVKIKGLGDAF